MNRVLRFTLILLGAALVSGCCCSLTGRRGEVVMIQTDDNVYADLLKKGNGETHVPTPQAPSDPKPSGTMSQWIVKSGDSLWTISREIWGRGIYWRGLVLANGLEESRALRIGQVLEIPSDIPDIEKRFVWTEAKAEPTKLPESSKPPDDYPYSHLLNLPDPRIQRVFRPGEKLSFVVSYLGMDVGEATMEVKGIEDVDGYPCLRIETTARSTGIFSKLYPVKDKIITWMDVYKLYTRRFEKHIHEFKYHLDEVRTYDQEAHIVTWDEVKTHILPPKVHDMLSAFYLYRCLKDLHEGKEISFWTNMGAKNYELRVDYLGKKRIRTRAGTFDCIMIRPRARFEGFFVKKGEVIIYLTDDDRRIPVKVVGKAPIMGKVTVQLVEAVVPSLGGDHASFGSGGIQ